MTVKRTSTVLICLTFCAWLSCKKEFDHPPYTPAAESARIGIGELKQRTSASGSIYRFTKGDTNLYCTLISDESSGNFFKQVYAKDDDGGAILLNLLSSGGLYAGDRIRINLNNTNLVCANNMISLDSVNTEKNIVKLSSGNVIAAKPVTIGDILKYIASPADPNNLQSQLVELNGVEFDTASRNKPFGDAIGKTSLNRILTNCAFQQLTLRTSGFADFASRLTPSGSGKITALVSQYGNIVQLTMRRFSDVQMLNAACTSATLTPNTSTFVLAAPVSSLYEQFNTVSSNTDASLTGWINYNETGSVKWKGDVIQPSYKCIKASAFNSGNTNNTIWWISPPVIYNSAMTFSFNSAFAFWDAGHPKPLSAYISTNFNGKNFKSANWTEITGLNYADGTGPAYNGAAGMKASGILSLNSLTMLSGYTGNFFIAFKYSGTSVYNSTIYLDDIRVK